MEKTELSEVCNVSRQSIYNCLNRGLNELEIIKLYTRPLKKDEKYEIDSLIENLKIRTSPIIKEVIIDNNYKQKLENMTKQYKNAVKDLTTIRQIIKRMILNYQELNIKEINFIDINEIYEIVKKY